MRSLLGAALAGLDRSAEAEPLLLSGYQGLLQRRDKIPLANQPALEQAAGRVLRLYQDWGKPQLADEWRERLQRELPAGRTP